MERTELIRQGNRAFNELRAKWDFAKLKEANDCFTEARYQDGLFRIADFLYYERKLPLLAVSYYKKINTNKAKERLEEIRGRLVQTIKKLLKDENPRE